MKISECFIIKNSIYSFASTEKICTINSAYSNRRPAHMYAENVPVLKLPDRYVLDQDVLDTWWQSVLDTWWQSKMDWKRFVKWKPIITLTSEYIARTSISMLPWQQILRSGRILQLWHFMQTRKYIAQYFISS